MRPAIVTLFGAVLLGIVGPSFAEERILQVSHEADVVLPPHETEVALRGLLSMSNERIVPGSSCDGLYNDDRSPAKVKDLLAIQLAFTDSRAKNTVIGSCRGDRCSISIRSEYLEALSTADIRFKTKNGKARSETLECHLTP